MPIVSINPIHISYNFLIFIANFIKCVVMKTSLFPNLYNSSAEDMLGDT